MSGIVRVFEGKDLVVPGDAMKRLGVKPGELVVIYAAPDLRPAEFDPDERSRRLRALDALWAVWADEDEVAFEESRREMWSSWQTHSSS